MLDRFVALDDASLYAERSRPLSRRKDEMCLARSRVDVGVASKHCREFKLRKVPLLHEGSYDIPYFMLGLTMPSTRRMNIAEC